MPVVRGQSSNIKLDPDRRRDLLDQFRNELHGEATPHGPVIFEIPLELPDSLDVLVVWHAWEGLRSEDRTGLIIEGYGDRRGEIAQALGVTYQEAMEQQLIPYAVVPMTRLDETNSDAAVEAMLEQGAIALPDGSVELRFPTWLMAEAAHCQLVSDMPRGCWSIIQTTTTTTSAPPNER